MSLVYSPKYIASANQINPGGTQYYENNAILSFAGPTVIFLDKSVYNIPGKYILFDYTDGQFNGNQTTLNNNVTPYLSGNLDNTFIDTSSANTLQLDSINKKIFLNLTTNPTVGKGYVEGDLVIETGYTIYLGPSIYSAPNTYHLFETIGGTISGDVAGINIIVGKSSLELDGVPYVEGNILKVTLKLK